jgi:hypothetical protein
VELRVLDASPPSLAKPFLQEDVKLDPWLELPGPKVTATCQAAAGRPLPFDVPAMPEDAP